MKTVIVLQARMGSSRLPGKVLRDLGGTTVLDLMIDRLVDLPHELVIATSTRSIDDPIEAFARRKGVRIARGSENDVLGRFADAAAPSSPDHVVRLTGDCPFVDPAIVSDVVATHLSANADYTSNTLLRTFPDGLDVEVMRFEALQTAAAEARALDEREHVTPFFARHPDRFTLAAHLGPFDLEDERWTVDTQEDFESIAALVTSAPEAASESWLALSERWGVRRPPSSTSLTLRVMRSAVDRPAGATELGATTADLVPGQPGSRAWRVERAQTLIGALSVTVRDGVGVLGGWIDGRVDPATIATLPAAIEQRLVADMQVTQLTVPLDPASPLSEHFRSAGFAEHEHGLSRIRLQSTITALGEI